MSAIRPLADQVAVVTGSSSGIGAAVALRLAASGAACVVHARQNRQAAEGVAESIRSAGGAAIVLLADVALASDRERLVAEAWQWRGAVDIWMNNAGADVLTGEAAHWSFDEKLARLWSVDVAGTIGLAREAGARMRARGKGAIVNIGWDQAEYGMAGDSGEMFATVKAAIMAFTKSLARSLAPAVRVNCVAPGWIKTAWGAGASDYWQARAEHEALRARWGTPEDIAAAVEFLGSPAADFITGQILPVNGGFRGPFPHPPPERGS
jgi:3-oxoacyl-[acyl-carrier protein] reductase